MAMRGILPAMLILLALAGCVSGPLGSGPNMPAPMVYGNPIFAPYPDAQYVFDTTVDVVGDYFRLEHEEPVRMLGTVLTEGRIDTYPQIGATIFEPWDYDSANGYERWESTLQSMRRRSVVKVTPAQGGYWIEVVVYKELENCWQPEQFDRRRRDLQPRRHVDARGQSRGRQEHQSWLDPPRPRSGAGAKDFGPVGLSAQPLAGGEVRTRLGDAARGGLPYPPSFSLRTRKGMDGPSALPLTPTLSQGERETARAPRGEAFPYSPSFSLRTASSRSRISSSRCWSLIFRSWRSVT